MNKVHANAAPPAKAWELGTLARALLTSGVAAAIPALAIACSYFRSSDSSGAPQAKSAEQHLDNGQAIRAELPEILDDDSREGADDFPVSNSVLDYDIDHPAALIALPKVLSEISDIAVLSENTIACVQDEQGIVFVYDWKANHITDEIRFASHGDYEGLALVDSQIYVLRSDGVLFELSKLKHHPSVRKFELQLPFSDSEGLCLDARHDRLLIAPKSHDSSSGAKDSRPIYAFDLHAKTRAQLPAFEISVREIRRFAKHHNLPIPRRPRRNGEGNRSSLHFMPSAIAVHPYSGEIFVVSATDHVMVSCNEQGGLTGYALLDASIFRQPEGIAFLPNGDMLVSNEAAGKEASLVVLHRIRDSIPNSASGSGP